MVVIQDHMQEVQPWFLPSALFSPYLLTEHCLAVGLWLNHLLSKKQTYS